MKAIKVITDPNAFDILADETRRKVIYLLRAKEMTVAQIAAELELTPQAIYHHIRKLRDSEMIEVAREERVDHFIETYYRATAEVFHLSHGEGVSQQTLEDNAKDALAALQKLGFEVSLDPKTVSRIVELEQRIEKIGEEHEWMQKAADLEDVDFFTKQCVMHYAKLLSMDDEECEEYLRLFNEERKLLRKQIPESIKA